MSGTTERHSGSWSACDGNPDAIQAFAKQVQIRKFIELQLQLHRVNEGHDDDDDDDDEEVKP